LPPWTTTPRIELARWLLALCCLLPAAISPAQAQTVESVLRPGDLVQGHAKWEEDCSKCHVRFERAAQDRLCMDCHKEVGQDMRERTGFHGRQKPQPCRACHTDHKGRNARIVEFDKNKFDHAQADFVLRGKHAKVECDKCHEPGKKYWQAASDCNACHKKDDVHKGSLGAKCADCHTENDWKEKARFDHDKTRFALKGKHTEAQCVDCHKKGVDYKEAPRSCIGCHKKDDDGAKGHKGLYGERCDSCHGVKAWKPSIFNHDTDTKYALRGKHRTTKCADCHTGPLYKQQLGTACVACHKKDDDGPKGHKGSLGRDCAACHSETGWKEKAKFDHDKTLFPLLGKHGDVKCTDCHKSSNYKEAPKDCIGCHKKDDKHEATLGTTCESCHNERDWKNTSKFDHDKTHFKLRNAHAAKKVVCKDCHSDLRHYRDTSMECLSCHKKDDKHEGQLGARCDSCHNDRDWKLQRFDHAQTRFPLLGRHGPVKCADCHKTQRYKDAPRDCNGCHRKDDAHKLKFGTACESCHNTRAWGIWSFDHNRRTKYALDGAHTKVPCERCHTQSAPPGRLAADVGTNCIACHRRDDAHDGAFGPGCEQCHATDNWKRIRSRVGLHERQHQTRLWAALGYSSRLSGATPQEPQP
jgi:hypothetical protein